MRQRDGSREYEIHEADGTDYLMAHETLLGVIAQESRQTETPASRTAPRPAKARQRKRQGQTYMTVADLDDAYAEQVIEMWPCNSPDDRSRMENPFAGAWYQEVTNWAWPDGYDPGPDILAEAERWLRHSNGQPKNATKGGSPAVWLRRICEHLRRKARVA
ncbi:MAG: hypothetical protein GEV06_01500 [Luteitalea sp.]|nr:hypothetical protein [Luteitalea sp.]